MAYCIVLVFLFCIEIDGCLRNICKKRIGIFFFLKCSFKQICCLIMSHGNGKLSQSAISGNFVMFYFLCGNN